LRACLRRRFGLLACGGLFLSHRAMLHQQTRGVQEVNPAEEP
jgi:hypothetical protein